MHGPNMKIRKFHSNVKIRIVQKAMQRRMVHQGLRTSYDWNFNSSRQKDLIFDSSITNRSFGSRTAWNDIGIQSRQGL